ncbi:MAG: fibrobacter succinogenes major paralogous domain-containing protein [Bacteroidales bacterium]|nr:fibrobacter succinogenes major paralogous domain-containing protein [Bacteroidales bacterium]
MKPEMSHRKLNILIFAIAFSICIISCKKDEEATVTPSLSGTLSFSIPEYVSQNTTWTITPSGVIHPDGEGIGYYWKVTPTKPAADTTRFENGLDQNGKPSDGSFTFTFSDTLQTCTISGYAFAKGYSYTSKSVKCTVVKGGIDNSITNLGLADKPSITVDGIVYPYVTIGGLDWLCRNIADKSAGASYKNCEVMNDVFGVYYSFEEAQTICPEGWRLPTDAEWVAALEAHDNKIAQLMGKAYFNDNNMWEYWPKVGDITNTSGLSIIPVGYAMLSGKNSDGYYSNAQFNGLNEYAAFWTADSVADEEGMSYYRYIICDQPELQLGKADTKTFGANVRCVR